MFLTVILYSILYHLLSTFLTVKYLYCTTNVYYLIHYCSARAVLRSAAARCCAVQSIIASAAAALRLLLAAVLVLLRLLLCSALC